MDACGVICPEPVIRAKLALMYMQSGQTLELLATDDHAELDLTVFCTTAGHHLRSADKQGQQWRFVITKG